MKIEAIAIDRLIQDPSNARKHSDKNLAAIKGSLAKFGQQKPIVIDKNNIVIAGNGTLAAAQSLGWQTINVIRTDLEGTSLVAYGIADNRTGELAEWDDEALSKTLEGLKLEEFDLDAIGFSDEDLNEIIRKAENIDMPDLPDGDKSEMQSMTFILHNDQAEAVKNAIKMAKATGQFDESQNKNGNGNAIALICEVFITKNG